MLVANRMGDNAATTPKSPALDENCVWPTEREIRITQQRAKSSAWKDQATPGEQGIYLNETSKIWIPLEEAGLCLRFAS
uniref:AlNc14C298G10341 protein n=1 Tax=Albugo laibachii Nc14 TaxID=890382 RepID=F0WVK6_9STRA|nr:AlNc14C298G10341 [Albugo laibachii Nc14]|eukprot:CCA25448.1 AlNc14C298G10341 [Albugo laibachii Nc14]